MSSQLIIRHFAEVLERKGMRKCPSCSRSCVQDCNECLTRSYYGDSKTVYHCDYARAAYILTYFYKYKGEIYQGLNERVTAIKKHLELPRDLHLISIGTGPGSELAGFLMFYWENFLRSQSKIIFHGIEVNNEWKEDFEFIAEQLNQYYKNFFTVKASFINLDALKGIKYPKGFDILFFPYVISEFEEKLEDEEIKQNLVDIWKSIKNKIAEKSLIFFNDIHHIKVRKYFEFFDSIIMLITFLSINLFQENMTMKKF